MKFTQHDNDTQIAEKANVFKGLFHSDPQLVLSPVPADNDDGDEILNSIQQSRQEDSITLEEMADPTVLDAYWTKVHDDLERDPEWFKFAED